ncbi:MAG: hypothetical protein ABGX87_14470 [Alcanivorax sp.]|uniref:Uncharacterized protein n=1 Tax=Alloalcanivorax marinus TaxID=1177169 RepID=A0A9Q3UP24_9GAMM|nr:hypothetical protein [Alloalcanivorax marinus]MBM7333859.1 hypothetical protein [Alloalcanivorax marinus]MCC4309263.1 hypothetical protein [Alloalcanivorax marinus]
MDTIISRQEVLSLPARGAVNLLHFHQGMVLVVGADAVGLYRDRRAVEDPLANGLVGYEPIPDALRPVFVDPDGFVSEQTSGFIGLSSGAALFVRPDGVALYPSGLDALHNRDCCWLIPFPPLNA